jgi:hypothetical protein
LDPELDPDPDPLVRGMDPDPDPHQNVTDPQHWFKKTLNKATPPSSPPPLPFQKGSPLLVSFHEYTTSHPFPTLTSSLIHCEVGRRGGEGTLPQQRLLLTIGTARGIFL